MPQTGNSLGNAILKALGIEPKGVIGLDIGCQAGDMATVTIVRVVRDAEAGEMLRVLEQYALERKPEDPQAKAMEQVARNLTRG